MQSSFNVIKEYRALSGEKKTITTNYEIKQDKNIVSEDDNGILRDEKGVTLEQAEKFLETYQEMATTILKEANKKNKKMLAEATIRAEQLEKEAYQKGYDQGLKNGFEDGRKEALEKAQKEADEIVDKATKTLLEAEKDYSDYLESKQIDILNLVIEISKNILKRDISENTDISSIVEEAMKLSKDEENVIIKCNPAHVEELKTHITIWKPTYNITSEIFILEVDSMKIGNAVIEKNSGRIEVGIDVGLEKIKNVLFKG